MPDQLHLLFLPAYSPELQPAEHLLVPGPLTNTVLINRLFADLEELEDAQARRCDAATLRHPAAAPGSHPLGHALSLVAALYQETPRTQDYVI